MRGSHMGAETVFIVVSVILALGAAALAGTVLYMFRDGKARLDEHGKSLMTVEAVIQELSRDLEKKFLYYAHDPNKVLQVGEGMLTVSGTNTSKLMLGTAELYQDAANKVLRIENDGTGLSLTKEHVAVSGQVPKLRVGNHYLTSSPLGLRVCDMNDVCKTI